MTRFSRDYAALLAKAQDDARQAKFDREMEFSRRLNTDFMMKTIDSVFPDKPTHTDPSPSADNFDFVNIGIGTMRLPKVPTFKPLRSVPVFPRLCLAAGYPEPEAEYQFHPTRKWRFDYAWPEIKLALEEDGGIWRKGGGAHSHPSNIERDIEKGNAAALLGWRILRYAPEDLALAIIDLRGMFNA